MSPLSNIIVGLGSIAHMLITVYIWIIIIAALLSWVRPDPNNPIIQMLYRLSEPAYAYLRKYVPTVFNGIDLAPLMIIVGLQIADVLLVNVITALAQAI